MVEHALSLSEWESFYVITGSSGAALTGLMFVVVSIAGDRGVAKPGATKAFATPTIVQFCAVLLVAALLTMPAHTMRTLAIILAVVGLAGLGYTGRVLRHSRIQKDYEPELEDWIWYLSLPFVGYGGVLLAGILLAARAAAGLYVVAAAVLVLLFIGIHNAWDSAIWISTRRPAEEASPGSPPASNPVTLT